MQQGNLLGRDVVFTYGPLSQWIAWVGVELQGNSVVNGFALGQVLMVELALVLLYVIVGMQEELDWLEAIFVFIILYAFTAFLVRPLSGLLAVVLFIRALSAKMPWAYGLATLAGVACFASQMLSIDFGVLALGTCGLVTAFWFGATLVVRYRPGAVTGLRPMVDYVKFGLTTFGVWLILNVAMLVYFHFSSPTYHWLDYWRYGLITLTRYNYAMAFDWLSDYPARGPFLTVVIFAMLAYSLYYAGTRLRQISKTGDLAPAYVITGLTAFACINLKSALTRSDIGHILYGMVGLLLLFSLAVSWSRASRPMFIVGVVLLVQALSFWPYNAANYLQTWPTFLSRPLSLSQQWQAIQSYRVNLQLLVPDGLDQYVAKDKLIVSFPYNNIIPVALKRQTLAPVLQGYAAFDTKLQELYVQQLQVHLADTEVIYGLDDSSPVIGEVEHASRLPIIFEYLARNFMLKTPKNFGGYLVLTPRTTVLPLQRFPLAFQAAQRAGQTVEANLGESRRCPLIELQLTVGYPVLSILGRPDDVTVQVWNDGHLLQQKSLVAIETGTPFSTFVYLGNSQDFEYIFTPERTNPPNIQLSQVVLVPGKVSLFDVQPNTINLLNINCIQ